MRPGRRPVRVDDVDVGGAGGARVGEHAHRRRPLRAQQGRVAEVQTRALTELDDDAVCRVRGHAIHVGQQLIRSGAENGNSSERPATPQAPPVFNDRQRKVLRFVLEGLSNKEIAWQLQISESYVKAILQGLFQKTGVRTRGQLVRVAVEQYEDQL